MKKSFEIIRKKIIASLIEQGFIVFDGKLILKEKNEVFRSIQIQSRSKKIKQHINFLASQNGKIKQFLINGVDVDPRKIQLELRIVKTKTHDESLFKWWNFIWWSIPYERAYGRQMRFLLWDTYHDKPFGLIGLHSAPLKIKIRDEYLGIKKESRDWWINMSMSAQRVGALPPYNRLLGGKMVAMTLASKDIREAYQAKYEGKFTLMKKRELPAELLFVTTTGAFGKSSIYNRIKYKDDKLIEFLGYTQGSGAFHIPENLYQEILIFLQEQGVDVSRGYGHGPSRKRQLLSRAFQLLDLPDFEYHGIKRAFYLISHAKNLKNVIEKNHTPAYKNYSIDLLCDYWKERWALPRAQRFNDWKTFDAEIFWQQSQRELEKIIG